MRNRSLWYAVSLTLVFAWTPMVLADVGEGLVLYYPFNGDGDVLIDESGNGFDGELNSAVRSDEGLSGGAIDFPDRETFSSIPAEEGLTVTAGFTLSLWLKPSDLDFDGENRVSYKHQQFNMDLLQGKGRFEIRSDGGWLGTAVAETPVTLGEWVHIVGTFSPSSGSAMYHNAVWVTGNDSITSIEPNTEWWKIGNFGLGGFGGLLDELRFYHRAMSEAEVRDLFEQGIATTAVSPEGSLTVAWGGLKALR
ncbi:MAG: hypothetical protein QF652_07975 [Dehalococcoidia bacterium]|nr:hypothetical protein [Dehalococcoidia bacterium]